ncbi:MAG: hypothetical protein KIS94_12305 [Chitinophagales bacterium]|nr:hypothetical protein [Chitinophagales bacterium]
MKKVLVVCLLGVMGMLLPTQTITAKETTSVASQKIVDVFLEDEVLIAHSQTVDGPIIKIVVTNVARAVVLTEDCGGYSYECSAYVGNLPAGLYVATVITTRSVHAQAFTLGD